jgi:DNA repair protein RecO (recombination protein O)
MGSRERQLSGHVLQVRDFGEAHRIVEVLTAEEGRLAAVARNARVSQRRFAGALDLFATLELELTVGPTLWVLKSASLRSARLGLREDLERLVRASIACEAVRQLVPEHQAAPAAFRALAAGLDCLDQGDLLGAAGFYPRLLAACGITPDFDTCARCGRPPEAVAGVDAVLGGVVCTRCAPARPPMPALAVAVFAGAACPDRESAACVEACAIEWIQGQTGRAFRSRLGFANI